MQALKEMPAHHRQVKTFKADKISIKQNTDVGCIQRGFALDMDSEDVWELGGDRDGTGKQMHI